MSNPPHQCPGSDIRIMSPRIRLRMSEPKGHWQVSDSGAVLDLTFAWGTRAILKRMSNPPHQCPGSDIRIMSPRIRLRMSEPKGHWLISDSGAVLDLTFAWGTRGNTEANVKSTAPVSRF